SGVYPMYPELAGVRNAGGNDENDGGEHRSARRERQVGGGRARHDDDDGRNDEERADRVAVVMGYQMTPRDGNASLFVYHAVSILPFRPTQAGRWDKEKGRTRCVACALS